MIGIGIVLHNDIIDKSGTDAPDIYETVISLVDSIHQFTEEPHHIYIRDNDSLDYRFKRFNVSLRTRLSHVTNCTFLPSEVNSLTDAWNEIIGLSLSSGAEGVILFNQDVIVSKYWKPFVDAVKVQSNDYIAPMTSSSVYQPLQQEVEELFKPTPVILHVPAAQGFCFGLSKKALKDNMLDGSCYFNPAIEWGYNEEDWVYRNRENGGRVLIFKNAYVFHLDKQSWHNAGLASSSQPRQRMSGGDRVSVLDVMDYSDYVLQS